MEEERERDMSGEGEAGGFDCDGTEYPLVLGDSFFEEGEEKEVFGCT